MQRRRFLQTTLGTAAAGAAAFGVLRHPRRALAGWGEWPADKLDAMLPPERQAKSVLELFLYGGVSAFDSFYCVPKWGQGQGTFLNAFLAETESRYQSCGFTGELTEPFADDANGTTVHLGPWAAPLRARPDIVARMRVLVQRHDSLPHEGANPFALTGSRLGSPRLAGVGAAIQRHFLERPGGLRSAPYAYILYPGFGTAYLGRRMACLECHNSEDSVTYSPDPAQNHHWAIPGKFEAALFGDAKGRPEAEVFAAFRWGGFVTDFGARPWGMSGACGAFNQNRGGDLLGDAGYLGGALPQDPYLFDLDPKYRAGLQSLAAEGLVLGKDMEVAPDQALAFLLAANIANNVWREAMGYPLTLANAFPRNAKQREILQELTEGFVAERYSVRELVTAVALHPYFNQDAPDACGAATPYHLEPVFEPFSRTATDPNVRGNSVGDRVQRHSAWVLVDSAARAMWWDLPARLADGPFKDGAFLRDQGAFLKDALPGFNGVDFASLLGWEAKLAGGQDPGFSGACTGPLGGGCAPYEWIEEMLVAGAGLGDATIGDLAAAIKDRLITEPTIDPGAEADAIAGVFGFTVDQKMNGLDTGLLEAGARRFAGLLLNTPQFMLAGVPSRDQDPAAGPRIVVPGTDTLALCNALAPAILGDAWGYACGPDGITVTKK